jgi:hypothetical protein
LCNKYKRLKGDDVMEKQISGKEVGTISVHMYEEDLTGLPFFITEAENGHMLYVLNTIENALNNINLD